MKKHGLILCLATAFLAASCDMAGDESNDGVKTPVYLDDVAELLAQLPLEKMHLQEVYDAVSSSSYNGYDEEYTMLNLFENPGAGVGDKSSKAPTVYERPLRQLIDEQVRTMAVTKADSMDPDEFIETLTYSDIQIYWPYSEEWDGNEMPIITFDPENGSDVNIGYRLVIDDDGFRHVEEVLVDEETAMEVPVWVVNRNDDAGYTSLEMLRREDPNWGEGGGAIIVNPAGQSGTKAGSTIKTLVLKEFTMNRSYDSWFAGASEFFVKIGYMEDFTASTEAELKLYSPMVTDFMIVVKRDQVGIPQNFNAVLMSDWTDKSNACAFMIIEDDGGTRTSWTTKAKVFIESKSYGVEITLPLNVRDDIVWRGQLAYEWFDKCSGEAWPFGDVELTFDIIEN